MAQLYITRLSRLTKPQKETTKLLGTQLEASSTPNKNHLFKQLGALFSKADAFQPILNECATLECHYDIYEAIWKEASKLRSSGKLLAFGKQITCPVTAIHGDFDSHPAEGVSVVSDVQKGTF